MKKLKIEMLSAKQLSRLRNGHNVRVKKGEGLVLLVHPDRYDLVSRTFQRGKARTLALTPEELLANKAVASEAQEEAREVQAVAAPSEMKPTEEPPIEGLGLTANPMRYRPFSKSFTATPPSRITVTNVGGSHAMMVRSPEEALRLSEHLRALGTQTGENFGNRLDTSLAKVSSHAKSASYIDMGVRAGHNNQIYPAKAEMMGAGLHQSRRSSPNMGNRFLQGPNNPALMSQPFAAHFQWANTLPPPYQKFNGGK